MKKIYCYEYSNDINTLIEKLNANKYYSEYLIEYYNEHSFAIGIKRLSHSSGKWYDAIIEEKDNKFIIKGKINILPKREEKKFSLLEIIKLTIYVFLFPLFIIIGIGMLTNLLVNKIKKNPISPYNAEKRLDYFMINYLGCTKCSYDKKI